MAKQFLKSNLRIRTPVISQIFSKNILVATNQDEKILLEILKRNKTENNLNPKLSEKLLLLNITCLEGRWCCTTHTLMQFYDSRPPVL